MTLGFKPDSNLNHYLDKAEIKESSDLISDAQMASRIVNNQSELIKSMRQVIKIAATVGDEGTIDVISGMLSKMEKNAWLLNTWNKSREM